MRSKPEPVMWLHDTGQRIACFESHQETITGILKINDIPIGNGATLII